MFTFLLFLQFPFSAYRQETNEEKDSSHFHRVTLVMGHAHMPEGIQNDAKHWLVLASLGFDYDLNTNGISPMNGSWV